ncbi:MAG: hybrid sensor histidine kinase/response regulator [Desulfobacteraceae bacterium]|nr:hybrid sensor histidine kinase/response regulator [Desulfobacteraceae bacterium]
MRDIYNSRILIVDDTPKNIQVLGTILKQEGYQINVARSGIQALEMVDKLPPDLILLDVMMPEMDGFETCKRLKSSSLSEDIPIIFLTARTETEDIIKGFELGAIDYITKPFNATELLVRVRTHLDLKYSNDMIEKVSNERKELLHVLCHDLANPFVSIIGLAEIITSYSKYEELKDYIVSAATNGLDLIGLVRDMRVLEEHNLKLELFNLSEAIAESYSLLSSIFSQKNIKMVTNTDNTLNIWAERVSFINSVLNNILTNAVKFSYPGSEIQINSVKTGKGAELGIRDFGIGMPPELLRDIFDVKKTTSRPGTNEEIGTGFGMPLVKKFTDAYNGSIEVFSKEKNESPDDHGTEIKLILKTG